MSVRRSPSPTTRLARSSLLVGLALLIASPALASYSQATLTTRLDAKFTRIQLDEEDRIDFDRFELPKHRPAPWAKHERSGDHDFGRIDREAFLDLLQEKLDGIGDEKKARLRTLFRRGIEHLLAMHDRNHRHDHRCGHGGHDYEPKPKPKPPVVPEPSTALLMGLGLAGLGHAARHARR